MKKQALAICFLLGLLSPSPYTYTIIPAADHTWCYDVYQNGRVFIHQTSIPGQPGNLGFARKKDAEKIAALVVFKLENHVLPPTVTRQEMDSLHIKYQP